jgi:peptide/nickel transport system substrate-binding protein
VLLSIVPEAVQQQQMLEGGQVDLATRLPLEATAEFQDKDGYTVVSQPSWFSYLAYFNTTRPPLDNPKVRQALNYAIDKQLIIDAIYGGRAVALPGPLSPFNNFVNKSLEPYPYDPDKALALLVEAGWEDTDGDGILDKDGQPFAFTIDTTESFRPLAEAVAGLFRELGIDAGVRFWEYSVIKPQLLAGERMAFLRDWGDSAFDPVGHFEAKWHGFVEGQPYGRGNFSTYNNERVNELIKLGEVASDTTERQKIYDEAQQIVYDEAPAVFLILPEEAEAASMSVQNWEPASDSRINLHDVCLAAP